LGGGAAAGGGVGGGGALGAAGGIAGGAGIAGAAGAATGVRQAAVTATKTSAIRFVSTQPGAPVFQSGFLEDVFILSDTTANALVILANDQTMELILGLVQELDVLPQVLADINIFQLKRADAAQTAATLSQLLLGTTGAAGGAPGGGLPGGGLAGGAGALGGIGGALGAAGGAGGLAGGAGGGIPGAPGAIPGTGAVGAAAGLRITVDARTNSIIVAGNPKDLLAIQAIISRLDDADIQIRRDEVYQLHNALAGDVAQALSTFVLNDLTVISTGGQLTGYQEIQRYVVIVPEPITNKLLISATPQYFPKIMRLIAELDAELPQVVVQVLLAEVTLDGTEEFGVELGLQSPVLFRRGIIPLPGFFGPNGSVTYTSATGGLVQPGVTVNTSANPQVLPGYAFNSTSPLGENPVGNPGIVGMQGITNLGLGRSSPTAGIGGFVLSMSSDSFSLLMRALKTQDRIDILSRPQLTLVDNQTGNLLIGQNFPIVTSTNVTATGLITNGISYVDVGVSLQVTPKIFPDGKVLMRVQPVVSSVAPTQVSLGNGATATAFNTQTVSTTVIAQDGETMAIGGLIFRNDMKSENKVPWLGDLPGIGALFRVRFQQKQKRELIVILTPHVVRNRMERERILAEESKRVDWVLSDVLKFHGTSGMEPVLPPQVAPKILPGQPSPVPVLPGLPPPEPETLPVPQSLPPGQPPGPGANSSSFPATQPQLPPPVAATQSYPMLPPAQDAGSVSADQGKETGRWNLFHKN
jgi:type II secretory pathway component GspD/PulD (secretin)